MVEMTREACKPARIILSPVESETRSTSFFSAWAFFQTSTSQPTNDGNTHGSKNVVSSVGVVVDTTVKDGSTVLANGSLDKTRPPGWSLDKVSDIVNNTRNQDKGSVLDWALKSSNSIMGSCSMGTPQSRRDLHLSSFFCFC